MNETGQPNHSKRSYRKFSLAVKKALVDARCNTLHTFQHTKLIKPESRFLVSSHGFSYLCIPWYQYLRLFSASISAVFIEAWVPRVLKCVIILLSLCYMATGEHFHV
jgi:hypothetical protein